MAPCIVRSITFIEYQLNRAEFDRSANQPVVSTQIQLLKLQ
jgi:hypothetical protein